MIIQTHPLVARDLAECMTVAARPQERQSMRVRAAMLIASLYLLTGAAADKAVAHELPTYGALLDALMAGQPVTTLLDLALCTRDGSDASGPKVRGGSRITRFIIPNGQYVAFADTHLTLDGKDRPVTEYIRYRAMPDGNVTVRFARRNDPDGDVTPRGQFHCQLTHGIRFIDGEAPRALPLGTRVSAPVQPAIHDGHANTQHGTNGGDPDQ
jgi:hypothetical protein